MNNISAIDTRPLVWLGAPSSGGLALPAAQPTPSQLYAPRGVFLNDEWLIVADSGNHRVMIWHGVPSEDRQAADVVLGQPDFYSEGPGAGGRGPEHGLLLPTGVGVWGGKLFVADAWHHRVLIWNKVPTRSHTPPDWVLGQASLEEGNANRGSEASANTFYWPYGIGLVGDWFYVADTGNRRVLGWQGLPTNDRPADLVLGQPTPAAREENRGAQAGADSFRWPHAIAGDAHTLYVADAGNHRVLGWNGPVTHDRPADLVIGQPDFAGSSEWPYTPPGPQRLRFPYCLAYDAGRLAVADTANNRVLLWQHAPRKGAFHPADAVIGQSDFNGNGENNWRAVTHETLCWPYGLCLHRNLLAIADSGNNRVMLWMID